MSKRTALLLNAVIIVAYALVAFLAPTPWIMLGGYLGLAVLIRCATLSWASTLARHEPGFSPTTIFGVIAFNLIAGVAFSAVVVVALYWLGHYWLVGVKIIVPILAVFIAYKSTFPVLRAAGDNSPG